MRTCEQMKILQNNSKGYWGERIMTQIQSAWKVSENQGGKYEKLIGRSVDVLKQCYDENQVITKSAALEAEQLLLPASKDVKSYTIHCIAHAHIDMNWMWDFSETVSITLDSFRTMLDLMDEYPEFIFSQSQASTYKIVEEHDPQMLEQIRRRVQEGRWEVSASTWVEADKNMPNGESHARHILYTKRYLSRLFGLEMDALALDFEPDTFGHSRNIPEILNKGGVRYYFHHRAYDGHYLYRWRSPSAAEVLVHKDPMGYGVTVTADHLPYLLQFCTEMSVKDAMYNYGVGDHGGGPTRRDIELLLDMQTWPVAPTVKFSTYSAYFTALESYRDLLPIVDQELNFVFTGCYTSQSRIKMSNRIAEARLFESETLESGALLLSDSKNPQNAERCAKGNEDNTQRFRQAWIRTLFNQFHDILPGSGVIDTREYCLGEFQKTMAVANTQAKNAMNQIAALIDTSNIPVHRERFSVSEGAGVGFGLDYASHYRFAQTERGRGKTRIVHLFNPTEFDREEPVRVTIWDWHYDPSALSVRDAEDREIAFEIMAPEKSNAYWRHIRLDLLIHASVKGFGYSTYIVTEREATDGKRYEYLKNTAQALSDSDKVMENDKIIAVFKAGDMRLVSLIDKDTGQEMMDANRESCAFRLIYEDVIPKMYGSAMSAWCVGRYAKIVDLNAESKVTIYEENKGVLSQKLRYRLAFERSALDIIVTLPQGSKMLHFDVSVDWHELGNDQFIPQLNFTVPFKSDASKYRYDIPFGTIDREPIHDDTPGNSFVAALPDQTEDRPMILITDSKYGFRGVNNSLSVSLIRSSTEPDPSPEYGMHKIRLGVGIVDSRCNKDFIKATSNFNHPIHFVSGTVHGGHLPRETTFMKICGDALCSAIKSAEDGDGLVVRLYDANGNGGEVTVSFPENVQSAYLTDLTETKDNGKVSIDRKAVRFRLGAHEVATVKVTL
jgi:alpha-mannosidase